MRCVLDHVIVLVPPGVLVDLPSSPTDALTVTPGGIRADKLTQTKLVILTAASYIELIALGPAPLTGGAANARAFIDFALMSPSLRSSFPPAYAALQPGEGTRPDGTTVKWVDVLTFPSSAYKRG
ncbi:hypothetical protein DMC30DRAFT_401406 [Rhodotorula diobovata]|uniref:Glyoxalase-like domain-containing protein n=1 Tax=Rhodotorula diobovata TaxID=5288 RepID=A0A5C5FT01_9BASI|nr:hypothetical protein DMC30DRAFT_401406 [Rhodotorula diobovata]